MVPRARACRFSSVTSRGWPAKTGARAFSSPRTAPSIGTTSYLTPSASASRPAASRDYGKKNGFKGGVVGVLGGVESALVAGVGGGDFGWGGVGGRRRCYR